MMIPNALMTDDAMLCGHLLLNAGKIIVFYITKAFLGLVSACTETALFRYPQKSLYSLKHCQFAHSIVILLARHGPATWA